MYADYVKERLGKEYHETANGFCIYSFGPNYVYIEEIYVKPEARFTYEGTELANTVCEIAQKRGIKYMVGTVCPEANGSTSSLKALLSYKMQLLKIENGLIWFSKEI